MGAYFSRLFSAAGSSGRGSGSSKRWHACRARRGEEDAGEAVRGRAVLVTGCDPGGIGATLVGALVSDFDLVLAACLTEEGVDAATASGAVGFRMDITSDTDVALGAERVLRECERFGARLCALVNNAGVMELGLLDWLPLDSHRRVFDVNYFGAVRVTQALLPALKACGDGRVVFISSVAAHFGFPWFGAYSASKAALERYAEMLRVELAPWGLRTCCVRPAGVRTNMTVGPITSDAFRDSFAQCASDELKREYGDDFPQRSYEHNPGFAMFERDLMEPQALVAPVRAALLAPASRAPTLRIVVRTLVDRFFTVLIAHGLLPGRMIEASYADLMFHKELPACAE